VKKPTALGSSRAGGARNPHVRPSTLRFLRAADATCLNATGQQVSPIRIHVRDPNTVAQLFGSLIASFALSACVTWFGIRYAHRQPDRPAGQRARTANTRAARHQDRCRDACDLFVRKLPAAARAAPTFCVCVCRRARCRGRLDRRSRRPCGALAAAGALCGGVARSAWAGSSRTRILCLGQPYGIRACVGARDCAIEHGLVDQPAQFHGRHQRPTRHAGDLRLSHAGRACRLGRCRR
jgi:hypothetical protein